MRWLQSANKATTGKRRTTPATRGQNRSTYRVPVRPGLVQYGRHKIKDRGVVGECWRGGRVLCVERLGVNQAEFWELVFGKGDWRSPTLAAGDGHAATRTRRTDQNRTEQSRTDGRTAYCTQPAETPNHRQHDSHTSIVRVCLQNTMALPNATGPELCTKSHFSLYSNNMHAYIQFETGEILAMIVMRLESSTYTKSIHPSSHKD